MVVNILHHSNHKYSCHYKIIKYVDFELIIYTINLDAVLFFKVFNEFNLIICFLLNILLV